MSGVSSACLRCWSTTAPVATPLRVGPLRADGLGGSPSPCGGHSGHNTLYAPPRPPPPLVDPSYLQRLLVLCVLSAAPGLHNLPGRMVQAALFRLARWWGRARARRNEYMATAFLASAPFAEAPKAASVLQDTLPPRQIEFPTRPINALHNANERKSLDADWQVLKSSITVPRAICPWAWLTVWRRTLSTRLVASSWSLPLLASLARSGVPHQQPPPRAVVRQQHRLR
mmetsp:Transcript_43522/g.112720  ORF Transcript_43522/g.112720 Transcript_43522/m.112720 type:complete len:228 (+) Transcript_43522:117-800(+)